MFGRATIRLGIGPHSSVTYSTRDVLALHVQINFLAIDVGPFIVPSYSIKMLSLNLRGFPIMQTGIHGRRKTWGERVINPTVCRELSADGPNNTATCLN